MTKEQRQLASNHDDNSKDIRSICDDTTATWVDTTQVVMSFQLATVKVESGPIFTKLSVKGHDYYFDHVTGRLIKEENTPP